ncbi:hypothetical protein GCM10009863_66210 [Streptomyces axinellae]|uniref:Uncharacterized protein n=1 Tax=Streptomyces axinellae TaxID=552788 RepID=A0ABP6DD08_9ACTN
MASNYWRAAADEAHAAADEWTALISSTPAGSTPDPAAAARLCRENAEQYEELARDQT